LFRVTADQYPYEHWYNNPEQKTNKPNSADY
jgi:hypothetical protein